MSYIIGVQDVRKLRVSLDSVEPDHVTKYLFPCLKLKQECWIDHISGVALAGIVSKEQLSFLAVTSDVNVEYAFKTIKTWQHYGVPFDILKETFSRQLDKIDPLVSLPTVTSTSSNATQTVIESPSSTFLSRQLHVYTPNVTISDATTIASTSGTSDDEEVELPELVGVRRPSVSVTNSPRFPTLSVNNRPYSILDFHNMSDVITIDSDSDDDNENEEEKKEKAHQEAEVEVEVDVATHVDIFNNTVISIAGNTVDSSNVPLIDDFGWDLSEIESFPSMSLAMDRSAVVVSPPQMQHDEEGDGYSSPVRIMPVAAKSVKRVKGTLSTESISSTTRKTKYHDPSTSLSAIISGLNGSSNTGGSKRQKMRSLSDLAVSGLRGGGGNGRNDVPGRRLLLKTSESLVSTPTTKSPRDAVSVLQLRLGQVARDLNSKEGKEVAEVVKFFGELLQRDVVPLADIRASNVVPKLIGKVRNSKQEHAKALHASLQMLNEVLKSQSQREDMQNVTLLLLDLPLLQAVVNHIEVNVDNCVLQESVLFVYYALKFRSELHETLIFELGAFSAILEAAKTNTNPEVLAACVTSLYSIYDGLTHEQVEALVTKEVFAEMLLLAAVVFRMRNRKGWGEFRLSAIHNMAELLAFTMESRGTDVDITCQLVEAGLVADLVPLISSGPIRTERGVMSCLVNLLWTAIDLTDPEEWAEVNLALTANPLPALLDALALSLADDSEGTENDRMVYEPYNSATDRVSVVASKCINGMTEWIAASSDRLAMFNEEPTRQALCGHLLQCTAGSTQHLALTLAVLNIMSHLIAEKDRTVWLQLGVATHLCGMFETFRTQQADSVDAESTELAITSEVIVRLVSVLGKCCAVVPSRNHRLLVRAVSVCESFKIGVEYALRIVPDLSGSDLKMVVFRLLKLCD